ncbi:Ger(x)C family spore germination protein [Cohnella soli]|uniref:Ger(X)C family spore germination protein n=1 Tax=Cohnella soli TaxID=425005 RepID=A0ABW0HYA5_9BACL
MRRKLIVLLASFIALSTMTGCWNRRELDELAIAVAFGIDKADNGRFLVSAQVVDPSEVAAKRGGGTRTPVVLYQTTGRTIFEALRKMTTGAPRKIYTSHLRILVIQEQLAREGIRKVLDFLSRNHELRSDFFVVVAKGERAENVLKITTHLESIPANLMFSSLKTSHKVWAPTVGVTLGKLIDDIVREGQQPVITGLEIIGEQKAGENKKNAEEISPPVQLKYSGLGVFSEDRLVGWLNETESKAYNFIQNYVKSTVGVIECPRGDGDLSLELMNSKTKVTGHLRNGKPYVNIAMRLEANIGEVGCAIDLTKPDTITEVEKIGGDKVRKFAEETVRKVQEKYGADIFGFGEVMHRSHPRYWKKASKDWEHIFRELQVNVTVDVKIRHIGTESQSFIEQIGKEE